MKKLVYLLPVIVLMTGCALQIDSWKLSAAQNACTNLGGVDYLSTSSDGTTFVRCNNGDKFNITQGG